MTLPPAERARVAERLDRVLALAERPGSEGERAAAEAAVGRLICSDIGFWRERLVGQAPALPLSAHRHAAPHWRALAQACTERPGCLRPWEREFVPSLLRQATISRKQATILRDIARRVGMLGAA